MFSPVFSEVRGKGFQDLVLIDWLVTIEEVGSASASVLSVLMRTQRHTSGGMGLEGFMGHLGLGSALGIWREKVDRPSGGRREEGERGMEKMVPSINWVSESFRVERCHSMPFSFVEHTSNRF